MNDNLVENIKEKVKTVILENKLIENEDKIVVAVSGGPDSMCLIDLLYNLKEKLKLEYNIKYELVVAHVNHMIRKESYDEKKYVEEFCKKRDIPFWYKEANVPEIAKEKHMSEETCGREIRYEFFEEVRKKEKASKIAVAHNLNDNVETIFLNLFRGTGLKGLIGMCYFSENLIRPLLDIEKSDILEYNVLRDLKPCFDKTNEQDIYLRNKIRLNLIPCLKNEYNPNIMENIIRMKHILELDEDFLNKYTLKKVNESILEKTVEMVKFDFSNILNEHESIRRRYIRSIIALKNKTTQGVENVHILDILNLLSNNIRNKKYILGNKFTIEIIKKNVAIIY